MLISEKSNYREKDGEGGIYLNALLGIMSVLGVCAFWQIYIAHGKVKILMAAQGIQKQVREIQGINSGDVLYWANTAIYPQFSFSQNATKNIEVILYDYKKSWRDNFLRKEFDVWNDHVDSMNTYDFFVATFYEYLAPICDGSVPLFLDKRSAYLDLNDDRPSIDLFDGPLGGDHSPNELCIDLYKLYLAFYRIAANKNLIQGYREPNIVKRIKDLEQHAAKKISD